MATAVLVDAAFFLKRFKTVYPHLDHKNPDLVAKQLYTMCLAHVADTDLYRVLIYDCPPLDKKSQHPVTGEAVDFTKLPGAIFRMDFHNNLKKLRKVALRLGYLTGYRWVIKPKATKELLNGKIKPSDLGHHDVEFEINQKGVDMKIGLDIAALALKQQVKQIVLISGDGDFVPASKLARREGIDVVLDPMWAHVGDSLNEHVDGIKSTCPKPAGYTPQVSN
ncbi:MAG: NYN domain-containing protein [Pseudomonadales bacterium]|nr:NYN domain-containing protein [Pseudomonadales bacterium]